MNDKLLKKLIIKEIRSVLNEAEESEDFREYKVLLDDIDNSLKKAAEMAKFLGKEKDIGSLEAMMLTFEQIVQNKNISTINTKTNLGDPKEFENLKLSPNGDVVHKDDGGHFREMSLHDDWEGKLTCDKCGYRINQNIIRSFRNKK
jgi:hypothetical protein